MIFLPLVKFNNYLEVNGGVVGDETCSRALKDSDVSEETSLIRLVSQDDATNNDWLYLVLKDIVSCMSSQHMPLNRNRNSLIFN